MPDINAQRIGIFLCSLGMHLTVVWLLWQGLPFENGATRNQNGFESPRPVLTIGLVVLEKAQPMIRSTKAAKPTFPMGWNGKIETALIPASAQSREATSRFLSPEPPMAMGIQDPPPVSDFATIVAADYFPAGRLTRLPVPVGDIDLDVPAINEIAFTGTMELSVLIDETGVVTGVLDATLAENMQIFSDRVVERFKSARFIPGEIDGRPVKSQLQITVVSEILSIDKIE